MDEIITHIVHASIPYLRHREEHTRLAVVDIFVDDELLAFLTLSIGEYVIIEPVDRMFYLQRFGFGNENRWIIPNEES